MVTSLNFQSHPGQGILGPAPAHYACQPTTLPSALSTMTLQDPMWNMDTGSTSHLISNARNLSTIFNKYVFPSIHVGDGNSILVTNIGHSIIPSIHRPLHLYNVPVTPNIIKNLIFVRQFIRDNNCTIEFDAFGFSVKEFLTRHIFLRCDSSRDLYPVTKSSTTPTAFLVNYPYQVGYPGDEVLRSLVSRQFISFNKEKTSHICHACQLGKHVKLPFHSSDSIVEHCFDIIHYDLWTSSIHKFHADRTLSRYKACLVANDSSQQLGVDFDETFSPVVKPATIHMVLSLALSRKWPIHKLDVKNAFLKRSLYVLKQAPRAWFQRFAELLQHIIHSLHNEFDMTDLGALNYFLGISTDRNSIGLFLSQKKYALQLLERAHMVYCIPSRTPVDTESKLGSEGIPVQDPTLYRNLAGGYTYLGICLRDCGLWLQLYTSAPTSIVGYTDADWAAHPSHSSAEAEYRSVASVVVETAWLRNLLRELHSPILIATLVYCDNVRVLRVPSRYQYANIFIKGLPSALFEEFRSSLSVHPHPAPTAGVY
ncbi:ribonuclease H-like domain-containing protein [Tanacetum coccineum]